MDMLKIQEPASISLSFFDHHPIITLLFSLSFTIFVAKTCFFRKSNKKLPPSPPNKLPILGHLHQLGLNPHHSFHSMSRHHGTLMLLHLGSSPTLVVSSVAAAREILKTHDLAFSNRPKSSIVTRLFYDNKDLGFSPYGEYWRQMRGITVHQLLSPKRVRSFRAVREEETSLMIDMIIQQSREDRGSRGVNLTDKFVLLTNDVVCRIAFGSKYSEDGEGKGRKFKKLFHEFTHLMGVFNVGDFIPWLSWLKYVTGLHRRVERCFREMDTLLDRIIDDHVAQKRSFGLEEAGMDFVDLLLKIQQDNSQGVSLGRDNIKAILLNIFGAGTHTTSTSLEWAMADMLKHPYVLKEAQKEVREIVKPKETITESDIEKMKYLKAVIKESIRMHPPLPLLVPRESTKDVNVGGYDIPAGTRVFINAWSMGKDQEIWEEPDKFRPERFMGSDIDFKGQDFELIPFGAGRRGCPGITLATATIECALANLLHKLDWEPPGGKDIDMSELAGFTCEKKLPLVAVPIHNSVYS